MMDLIVETDIGHDPDDYFTLCHLHAAGVRIRAILVSPGHRYQVAIARAFCAEVGLDVPVGIAKETSVVKTGGTSFHMALLRKMGHPTEADPDGFGHELLGGVLEDHPDSDVFICGPVKNVGRYMIEHPEREFGRVTMQGGFLGYDLHGHDVERLPKFKGKVAVPTFNLNGSKDEGLFLASRAKVGDLRFVGKNVCHTILYDRARHEWMRRRKPSCRAMELFMEGMDLYLYGKRHREKKFHDPTAAVCHLHPEIGTWVGGRLYREGGWWGTKVEEGTNTRVLADVDREGLWDFIRGC